MTRDSETSKSSRSRGNIRRSSRTQISDDDIPSEGPLVIDCNFQSDSYQPSENSPLYSKEANTSAPRKRESEMPTRRKSAAKSRTPSRSSNTRFTDKGDSSTRKKRRRISRDRLEDGSTPDMLDSLLTDPDWNSLRESTGGRSSRNSSRTNRQSETRTPTPVRGRCVSLIEGTTVVQPVSSPVKKRSRNSRKQGLENIQMSLLSQTEQTDWLLPRRSTGPMSPGLVPNIKARHPSDSSQEAVDDFCWICHRPGQLKSCSSCPRVYHSNCSSIPESKSGEGLSHENWQCALCRELALGTSDGVKWGPVVSTVTYENQLNKALAFMIDFLSIQSWAEPFRESVDSSENFGTSGAIRYPMDLRTLLQRVNAGQYKSTNAFLADFLWIIHNCFISEEKPNPQLLVKARSLEQACLCEIELLRACPTCYLNRIIALPVLPSTTFIFPAISKCEPHIYRRPEMRKPTEHLTTDLAEGLWFTKPCTVIHPVVWVRFEEGRRWPGKMMAELPNKLLLVSFFGTYATRKTPPNYVTLHTCLSVSVNANTPSGAAATTTAYSEKETEGGLRRLPDSGELKDAETHARACEELRRHLSLLVQAFPKFRFPAAPASRVLPFSQHIIKQHYGSFNQWILAGNNLPSPASSESGAAASPGPTGDEVDFVHTSESCLPSSPSLATSVPSATPPAPSPPLPPPPPPPSFQTRLASAPPQSSSSSSSTFPLSGTSRSLTSEDFSEPLLARLSTNLLSSFRNSHGDREGPPHEPLCSFPHTDAGDKVQDSERNTNVQVGNPVYENVEAPDMETTPATDSTSSTLPLRHLDNTPSGDPKADLIARFQEARDLFSGRFQSLMESVFRNLEESINETCSISTAATALGASAASTAASEVEAPIQEATLITTHDRETQTASNVVVSAQFLEENKMKMALLRAEVLRQSQELERLRLLLDYTRYEVASSHRDRLTELRAVWEAELLAAVEGVVKICEQEASRLIDVVKRKQWCTYCGNEAFFYCCWNTVYCGATATGAAAAAAAASAALTMITTSPDNSDARCVTSIFILAFFSSLQFLRPTIPAELTDIVYSIKKAKFYDYAISSLL
ncbi:Protein kinase C-binding protein 1 [Echinococcus granulosus]|nr:Protein kinase C-binding protein 1 [Echinococcus granulosus]